MSQEKKPVVLTCMQPTGKLHLGNYLGAARNWARMIDDYECYFGIVDLHAITMPYDPAELRRSTLDCAAQYIACGLDPEKCRIFLQSRVTGHTELAWILACLTPVGQLERMTQYKDKSRKQTGELIGSGLLFYPVLMAADILIYNADSVPVGEDQRQHVELTRDIAIRFNNTYSETFKVPGVDIRSSGARIMSLQNPENKMSKSENDLGGTLFITDPPDIIRKKIKSAVTDSGSEIAAREDKPGISNLLEIMSAAARRSISDLENEFRGKGYGEFKAAAAEAVVEMLQPVQEKYTAIKDDKNYLLEVLNKSAAAAQKRANKTMAKVYRKAGFLERPRQTPC